MGLVADSSTNRRFLHLKDAMAKAKGRLRLAAPARVSITAPRARVVRNEILRSLPRKERDAVLSRATFTELPTRLVLNEITKPIRFGYFIDSGVASILNVTSGGKSVEIGLAGSEGFVGLPLLVNYHISSTRAVIQIAGAGYRIRPLDLRKVLAVCPKLRGRLHRYAQEFGLQVTQVAACNLLHRVDQRLARWFLLSQDRMGGSSFHLTQEFLSHMLGTRRASVTMAAGVLQKAGLITYQRGNVIIKNRAGLEKAACECYASLTRQLKQWRGKRARPI
jgi:CRP-like cAMP-binding protein